MSSALRATTGKIAQLKSTKFTETKRQQEAIERVNLSILGKKGICNVIVLVYATSIDWPYV